jgi:mRNA-degrading endonuclease RelE of RelBE toxin-antitoxin system
LIPSSAQKRWQELVFGLACLRLACELTHQPDQPPARRKPLEDNPIAPWKLRVGDFRVFYDINHHDQVVAVVAVGQKVHNRLRIGGMEIDL